jgi:hypothetical protein
MEVHRIEEPAAQRPTRIAAHGEQPNRQVLAADLETEDERLGLGSSDTARVIVDRAHGMQRSRS